jgi:hypothetical protein
VPTFRWQRIAQALACAFSVRPFSARALGAAIERTQRLAKDIHRPDHNPSAGTAAQK